MACWPLCKHYLKRLHWSCPYCRVRRFFYRKMDPKKYHYNRYLALVLSNDPKDMELYVVPTADVRASYVIFIDKRRSLANIKDIFLKRLLKVVENTERSYSESFIVRTMLLFRKQCLTISEMLAN
jgi:hypothetical protein